MYIAIVLNICKRLLHPLYQMYIIRTCMPGYAVFNSSANNDDICLSTKETLLSRQGSFKDKSACLRDL